MAPQVTAPIIRRHPNVVPTGKQTLFTPVLFASNNNKHEEEEKEDRQQKQSRAQSTGFGSSVGTTTTPKKMSSSKAIPKKKLPDDAAEFEMQELRAQLEEMARLNLGSANLSLQKRQELEGYVRTVCEKSPSPIPLDTLAKTPSLIKGMWRLGFSTERATLSILPKEATVYVNILTPPTTYKDGTLEYILKFAFGGLREIKATSTYTVDVSKTHSPCFVSSETTCFLLTFCLYPIIVLTTTTTHYYYLTLNFLL
jgi:hypothetical protein